MQKKLDRIGNSLGLRIPKRVLEMLGWDHETDLDLAINNQELVVRPAPKKKLFGRTSNEPLDY